MRPPLFRFVLEVLVNAIWREKRVRHVIIQKADTGFSLLFVWANVNSLYLINLRKPTKQLLEIKNRVQ